MSESRIFRRWEDKYRFGEIEARNLRREVQRHLPLFEFRPGRPHTYISTIYFDTKNLAFFKRARRSYDNSIKLRVKEYYYKLQSGELETFPYCFVEIKERIHGEVHKSRIRIPKLLLNPFLAGEDIWPRLVVSDPGIEFQDAGEVYGKLKRFLHFEIKPESIFNYRRVVFQRDEGELRVTFDDQLRIFPAVTGLYGTVDAMTRRNLGAPILPRENVPQVILEIKCPNSYPTWLQKALFPHRSQKTSKFTTSIDLLRKRPGNGRDGEKRVGEFEDRVLNEPADPQAEDGGRV